VVKAGWLSETEVFVGYREEEAEIEDEFGL
jgi:hypothetical protein